MKTFTEKESLLQNVNARISKKDAYYKLGEELEKYLSDAGLEYGIDYTVADFECINKNFFWFKVYIGDRRILDSFEGTLEELKETLLKELELEARNKVTCPFCGRKIVRYVAMNKLKNCECGARIEITNYTEARGSTIHMKRKASFRKSNGI